MTTAQRVLKQIFIVLILIVILGGMSFFGYTYVSTRPTPTPDPITQLSPVEILETQLISVSANEYDFWAKVRNPNTEYGSPEAQYEITFTTTSGSKILLRRSGSFYILPGQTRSIIETPLQFGEPIATATMKITNIEWQKISPLFVGGISLFPRTFSYSAAPQSGVAASVAGQISNSSDFDLTAVDVLVTVRDRNNVLVGVNKTNIMTFLSQTERGFRVSWPLPLAEDTDPASVTVHAEAHSNVFSNSNFIQRFVEPERFQNYY